MNVYQVLTKVFYTIDGTEYQAADALTPIQTYSSVKKAEEAMKDYIAYYKKLGWKEDSKYWNLFPVVHTTLRNLSYRVVIYYLKTEVE